MTHDKRHVTCDTLWGMNILSKFKLPSTYGWDRQCHEDSKQKDDPMNE